MSRFVLDASALLAYVQEEPGWETVERHLHGAVMSTVNYSEVLKKTIEKGGTAAIASGLVRRSRIQLVNFDAEQAQVAAELWPAGKSRGLSFADRACLALGVVTSATVLTTDGEILECNFPVKVVHVRKEH